MNFLLLFLEAAIPIASIIIAVVSSAVAWFTLRRTSVELSEVREKIEALRKSPVVEDHAELPGSSNDPERNDVDEKS